MSWTDHLFIPLVLQCNYCLAANKEICNNKILLCPSCGKYEIIRHVNALNHYLAYKK